MADIKDVYTLPALYEKMGKVQLKRFVLFLIIHIPRWQSFHHILLSSLQVCCQIIKEIFLLSAHHLFLKKTLCMSQDKYAKIYKNNDLLFFSNKEIILLDNHNIKRHQNTEKIIL